MTKINYTIKIQHEQKDVGPERELVCNRRIRSPTGHRYFDRQSNHLLFKS